MNPQSDQPSANSPNAGAPNADATPVDAAPVDAAPGPAPPGAGDGGVAGATDPVAEGSEPALAVVDQFAPLRKAMEGEHFWWSFLVIEFFVLGATIAVLWFWLKRVLPAKQLPEPRWGLLDFIAGFCVWFGVQIMVDALVTSLAAFEVIRPEVVLAVKAFSLFVVGIPIVWLIAHMVRTRIHAGEDALGLSRGGVPSGVLAGVTTWAISIFGVIALLAASSVTLVALGQEPEQQTTVQAFTEALQNGDYWTIAGVVALAVVLAPLSEEVIFRGLLFRWLAHRWGVPFGTITSGLAFGLVHMNLMGLVPLSLLGMLLALLYQRTGNLWSVIFMHVTFNGAMLTLQVFLAQA